MGLEDTANRNGGEQNAESDHVAVSIWKSLPGILTASGGIIVSITGLLIGMSQIGLIGQSDKPPPDTVDKPIVKAGETAVPHTREVSAPKPVSLLGAEREFKVGKMSDGFVWVRSEPSASSVGLVQLPSGTHVMCTSRAVADNISTVNRTWRYCSAHEGYVSARLLLLLAG